jgi:hypothetical protein
MIIYLDESGDLGAELSKSGTSQHFVITLLVCDNQAVADGFKQAVRRTLKNKVNHPKKGKLVNEFKGMSTKFVTKCYFYRHLPETGWRIYTIILDKARAYEPLTTPEGQKRLYDLLAQLILAKVDFQPLDDTLNLIMDCRKNREEIKKFNASLINQLKAYLSSRILLEIKHDSSQENSALQAVDLFCWGIYRKYERKDEEWYAIFKPAIVFEELYK